MLLDQECARTSYIILAAIAIVMLFNSLCWLCFCYWFRREVQISTSITNAHQLTSDALRFSGPPTIVELSTFNAPNINNIDYPPSSHKSVRSLALSPKQRINNFKSSKSTDKTVRSVLSKRYLPVNWRSPRKLSPKPLKNLNVKPTSAGNAKDEKDEKESQSSDIALVPLITVKSDIESQDGSKTNQHHLSRLSPRTPQSMRGKTSPISKKTPKPKFDSMTAVTSRDSSRMQPKASKKLRK